MYLSGVNDLACFKKLTLAINYLFLYFDAWVHQHYHEFLPSLPHILSLCQYMLLWVFLNSLFATTKIYMLILNLTHFLISLPSKFWHQLLTNNLVHFQKWKLSTKFLCDNKKLLKAKNRDNINTWISWWYSLSSYPIRLK